MLLASYIKLWRDSTDRERRDHTNGFTACRTYDIEFDTGLITVDEDLSLRYAPPGIEDDMTVSPLLRRALGKPPLHERLILAESFARPYVRI
jgi:putative restriction endonuclease